MQKSKKLILLLFVLLIYLFVSGCSPLEYSIEDKISPPNHNQIAIQGTWKIEKYIPVYSSKKTEENVENYIGKTALFDQNTCVFANEKCHSPEYKNINVAGMDYLQNTYRIDPTQFGTIGDRIDVITVTSNNQFFYEFIKIDEQTMLAYLDDGFLYLQKESNVVKVDQKKVDPIQENKEQKNREKEKYPSLKSGVLLGIRSDDNTYRTMWMSADHEKLFPIVEKDQLLVPRMKGFWEVGNLKTEGQSRLYARPVDHGPSLVDTQKWSILKESPERKITFVGPDYIGTERNSRYDVMPLDYIEQGKGITLSEVFAGNADQGLMRSSETFIASLERDKAELLLKQPSEDNFTLERRHGHWILRGRMYYQETVDGKNYEDFDINLLLPKKLINYDEMDIPWSEIKDKLPWITDAYLSPVKNFIILVSKNDLSIYMIKDGQIADEPLKEIQLDQGDQIIMAEWAIGNYVEMWEEAVRKY